MGKSKKILVLLNTLFLMDLITCVFVINKGDGKDIARQSPEEIPETEWQVEEDAEAAIGSNLFYGSSMAEGDGAFYTLDIGMYGGKPVEEDERCHIYRQEEGEWEVYISHPPYTTDVNSISNVIYLDGYIYYVLKEVEIREKKIEEEAYIFRFAKEDGYEFPDLLLSCDTDYYIYEDEIYFQYHQKGKRCFYKATLDGEEVTELYSDRQEEQTDAAYAVGGGCLYLKDGQQILGINLKNGERGRFDTEAKYIGGMFYEDGRLYIYDPEKKEVHQMDVRTGGEIKLIAGKILKDCVWIHDGYLYYVEGEKDAKGYSCEYFEKEIRKIMGDTYEAGMGTEEEKEDRTDIYWLKEGKWELFVSHSAMEEDPWRAKISVYNLTYYHGYLYYILLRDCDPGSGAGKDYSICRVSQQNGMIEELAKCNGNFFIYQDEIYYDNIVKKGRKYFRMKPDGKDKELLYFDDGTDYFQFTYAVGGDCLYLWSEEKIAAVHIVNDREKILKYFDVPVASGCSMFYENGKLYLFDIQNPVVYQMDVSTGEVNKVLEIFPDYQCKNPFIGDCVMVRLRMEGENEGDGYKAYIYS